MNIVCWDYFKYKKKLLDLQVAGLQGFANTLGLEKLVVWPGIEPGSTAYMAVALHFELLTTPVTMNEETLTDDP